MITSTIKARLFHAQYHLFQDDLPYWRSLAAQYGDPILEMGCGTGRIVHTLAEEGYRVMGIDQNKAMLDLARTNLQPSLQEKVTLVQSDLTKLELESEVKLALAALNTFAYLSDDQFVAALVNVEKILTQEGAIALDLPAFDANPWSVVQADDPLDSFTDPQLGTSIEVRAKITGDPGTLRVTWLYDEILPDGQVERHEWDQVYYQRTELDVRDLVKKSGLRVNSVHGDYDCTPHLPESERLLVVAVK
jgi:trans-aconitate methyltransferase